MSKVDDSHSERRAEEARLVELRAKENQQKQRTGEATAFDRALAEKSGEKVRREVGGPKADAPRSAPPPTKGRVPERTAAQDFQTAANFDRAGEAVSQDKAHESASGTDRAQTRSAEERRPTARAQSEAGSKHSPTAARSDALAKADQKEQWLSVDRQSEAKGEEGRQGATTAQKKGGPVARASDDGGGSGGQEQGGGDKKKGSSAFRLPPAALMAPPPLARPKEAGGRLAGVTQEIVDKIVSRVLVGTTPTGVPEFRIDLKSTALKGLSIRVSGGRGGKIRAVFSGSDSGVLQALKQSSSSLVEALAARGLTLEDLVFEQTPRVASAARVLVAKGQA